MRRRWRRVSIQCGHLMAATRLRLLCSQFWKPPILVPEISPVRFPFRAPEGLPVAPGEAAPSPLMPVELSLPTSGGSVSADGLLDTGASVNVLPYRLGLALGADWSSSTSPSLRLSGNLAGYEAHALILMVCVGRFAPVRLVFAWTRAEQVPLILGQTNFFMEFDVCFYRSRSSFDVRPKNA